MNDDELTRALESWAAATDPAADPITASALDDVEPTPVRAPDRSRRWLAVAAVVLALVGVAAAVVVIADDGGSDDVVADARPDTAATRTDADAVPLQVVLVNEVGPETTLTLRDPACDPDRACTGRFVPAQEPGTTSLVFDGTQPDDLPLRPTVTAQPCAGGTCVQNGIVPAVPPPSCTTDPVSIDGPTRVVLTVTPEGEGIACSLEVVETFPLLTVPPAFSTRDLPIVPPCGAEAFDAGELAGPSDREGAAMAFGCLEGALGEGVTTELVTSEARPDDLVVRSWWRVLAEPVDGHPIEVFRHPGLTLDGWVRTYCDGLTLPGYGSEVGTPYPCTDEDPLSLDPPPLAEMPTEPPTTTETAPPPGTVDVVLDVDRLPMFVEGVARRWSISIVGAEMASGPLTEEGSTWEGSGRPADVQLVGDDVRFVDEQAFAVTVDDYDCFDSTSCRRDGMGPKPGARSVSSCTAEAPRPRTGSVLVVTLRGETCDAAWADTVPALTVPPAWSLRPAATACTDLDPAGPWKGCLQDALDAGETAEWTMNGDGSRITFLVDAGGVQIVWRREDEPRWTVQHGCTLDQDDCGPEEEMSLEP